MPTQPLAGIKVLDFTTLLPGPLATLLLCESGAEVLKIEPPGGDRMRHLSPQSRADEAVFALLNAGKRYFEADLKDEKVRAAVLAAARKADVLIEQFRPGVMERLGLGYEALSAVNPRLIYCSITGYGQDGPWAQRAGHDLNYFAETGVLALAPNASGGEGVPPVLAADIAGGAYPAFFNILLALLARSRTGEGQYIDVAMSEGLFPFAFRALAQGWSEGRWPVPGGELLTGGSPRYHLYPASDGGLVAVAALEPKFWAAFCDAIALPEDLRDDRSASRDEVIDAVARIIAGKPASHWRAVFDEADCCCSIVSSLEQALHSPHFAGRGVFEGGVETGSGQSLPALPLPIMRAFRDSGTGGAAAKKPEAADSPDWKQDDSSGV